MADALEDEPEDEGHDPRAGGRVHRGPEPDRHHGAAHDRGRALAPGFAESASDRGGEGERAGAHQDQPGDAGRRIAEAFEEERRDDERAHVAGAGRRVRDQRRREVARAEEGQRQQRLGHPPFDRDEGGEAQQADDRARRDQSRIDRVGADAAEREHQPADADREGGPACDVEAHPARRRLAQHREGQGQRDQAEPRLEQEDDAPADEVDEGATDRDAQRRCRRRRHRPPAHRPHPLLGRIDREDQRHRGRLGRAAEDRGEGAEADQRGRVPGEGGEGGDDGGTAEAGEEDAAMTAQVAELPE